MLTKLKGLFHTHSFTYQAANGDRSTQARYDAGYEFTTKRCPCGETGHNIGYVPAPTSFELEPVVDY